MSTLKTNTLTGTTSAGSILVTGEGGSTTTDLQQGLAKVWIAFDGTGTISIDDSFNVTSITDFSTGTTTITIANDMASANYSVAGSSVGSGGSFNGWLQGVGTDKASGSVIVVTRHESSGNVDLDEVSTSIHGDLA